MQKEFEINLLLSNSMSGIETYWDVWKKPLPNRTRVPRVEASWENNPEHSWRVAIQGFIDSATVWKMYRMSEPYDSPQNLAASNSVPRQLDPLNTEPPLDPSRNFRIGDDDNANKMRFTEVLRISGSGTLGDGFSHREEIPDGKATTILLVYAPNSDILWTKPCDLEIDELDSCGMRASMWLRDTQRYVLFADGSVWQLSKSTTIEDFRAMCTVAGGEIVDMSFHRRIQ